MAKRISLAEPSLWIHAALFCTSLRLEQCEAQIVDTSIDSSPNLSFFCHTTKNFVHDISHLDTEAKLHPKNDCFMPLSGTIYERWRQSAEDTCHFRDQLSSCMTPKRLRILWLGQPLKKEPLMTLSGKSLRILNPEFGEPNRSPEYVRLDQYWSDPLDT